MLLAWLEHAVHLDDREAHKNCTNVIYATPDDHRALHVDVRRRCRAQAQALPELGALFALERPRRADEAEEPEGLAGSG